MKPLIEITIVYFCLLMTTYQAVGLHIITMYVSLNHEKICSKAVCLYVCDLIYTLII